MASAFLILEYKYANALNLAARARAATRAQTMVFPKANKTTPALNRAIVNTLNSTHQNKTAIAKLWGTSAKCPLFLKKLTKKAGEKGKRKLRGNRALSAHSIKALASGATANAVALIEAEAALLRNDTTKEAASYPALPSVGRAAASLFETAIIAYVQEVFGSAVDLTQVIGKHKKVTNRSMQVACDTTNGRIARATGLVPDRVVPKMPIQKRAKITKKPKKEEEVEVE